MDLQDSIVEKTEFRFSRTMVLKAANFISSTSRVSRALKFLTGYKAGYANSLKFKYFFYFTNNH